MWKRSVRGSTIERQAMMLSIAGGDIEERNLVAMRLWETPVLIPNTKVKT